MFRSPRACRHVLLGDFRCRFDRIICSCAVAKVLASSTALLRAWLPEMRQSNSAPVSDYKKSTNLPLMEIMMRFRQAKASLLHDRVFALLSISAPGTEVPVDYEADFRAVCIDIASNHVMSEESLIFLLMSAATLRLGYDTAPDLPSWVPDWGATPAILESDPQKLENLESDMVRPDFAHEYKVLEGEVFRSIKENVLMIDVMMYESNVFSENEPRYGCRQCHAVNSADWLEWKSWARDKNCGRVVVFQLDGGQNNVLLTADVIEQGHIDALNVVLNSYHIWPAAHGDGHHWHAHRRQQQTIHIH